MNDIVAFLTAQYDAEQAAAESAQGDVWTKTGSGADFGPAIARVLFHQRFGPARVLSEIAAKRAILAEHEHRPSNGGEYTRYDFGCITCHLDSHCGTINGYGWCPTVRMLAAPYEGAEGYDPDWRIT